MPEMQETSSKPQTRSFRGRKVSGTIVRAYREWSTAADFFSCARKRRYTQQEAQDEADRSRGRRKVYPCTLCGGFHLASVETDQPVRELHGLYCVRCSAPIDARRAWSLSNDPKKLGYTCSSACSAALKWHRDVARVRTTYGPKSPPTALHRASVRLFRLGKKSQEVRRRLSLALRILARGY